VSVAAAADPGLVGSVRPRWLWAPPHASTAGPEAVDLAASVGRVADPAQRLVLDVMLAERADGSPAAFETCLVAGRQNLKTWCMEAAALHSAFVRGVPRIVWTAHRFKTCRESFLALKGLVDNYDHLRRRVSRVRVSTGDEGIALRNGCRVDFLARTSGGGRGLAADEVFLDEALYLTDEMMGALLPVLSARPGSQVRYGSSAGLVTSAVLRRLRERGRAGGDPSLAYAEYGTEPGGCADPGCDHHQGAPGCALDDETRWAEANPALGRRMTVEHLRAERRAMAPEEFARERLGWWTDPVAGVDAAAPAALPAGRWPALAADLPGPLPVVAAVDVARDRSSATVAVAAAGPDGLPWLDVVRPAAGVAWVVGVAAGLGVRVLLDPGGAAGALVPELVRAGVDVVPAGPRDRLAAAGGLFDRVEAGTVRHSGDPLLAASAAGARRRDVGSAWDFDPAASDADVGPVRAAALALHGWATRPDTAAPTIW